MTPELEILGWAARRSLGAGENLAPLATKITDWNAVLECAAANSMIPPLARSLLNDPAVPMAARRQLDKWYTIRVGHNAKLARELHALLEEFRQAGIPALAYKGPALAMLAYGNLASRNPSADLDLLLHKHDILRAKQIAEARGYRSILSEQEERFFLEHRYHIHLDHGQDRDLQLELHWALSPAYWRFPLDYWSRARPVVVAGAEMQTLDAECSLLAVCAHGCKEGWPKLSQVLDVARLIRSHPALDWHWVLGEARRMGRERVLHLGLYLAQKHIGVALPEFAAADVASDPALPGLDAEISAQFGVGYYAGNFRDYAVRVWHHPMDRARYFAYALRKLPERMRHLAEPSEEDRKVIDTRGSWKGLHMAIRPFRALQQRGWARVAWNAKRTLWQ